MAMVPVSEEALSGVTGQAGVSINADIMMNVGMGTVAWGDSSGIDAGFTSYGWTAAPAGGYVGVNNLNIQNLRIKARETDTFNGYSAPAMLKPITIDVGSDDTLVVNGGYTFVRIGLGSLEISMDSMSMQVALGDRTGGVVLDQILGTANLGSLAIYINPISFIDIYNSRPGSRCGVTLSMNIVLDRISMAYLSWGDTDGAANTGIGQQIWMSPLAASAGYVGLANLVVGGPVTVAGTMLIDIATSSNGIYAHGQAGVTPGAAPVSVVHIGFPSAFSITVNGPITADVKLDGTAALDSANAKTLGNIYMTGFGMTIIPGSWVDVWAH